MASAVSDLRALRDRVARIERAGETGWPARPAGGCGVVPLGDGALPLDRDLGGGLKRGTLHELLPAGARDTAAAGGFATALAARCSGDGAVVWIVDERTAAETGTPYRPGLAAQGLDPANLLLVRTRDATSTLWATEEALRAGARVVLTELWRARSYDLAASRRLLLASRRRGATCLLLHVGLGETVVSSAADTRFTVAACPGERRPSAGGRVPIPGPGGFAVRLTKVRSAGAGLRDFDAEAVHALAWDQDLRAFRPLPPLRGAKATKQPGPAQTSAASLRWQ